MKRLLSLAAYILITATVVTLSSCKEDNDDNNNKQPTTVSQTNAGEAIDLGLSSGTKWASFNVGAKKPEQLGGCFAWGESVARNVTSFTHHEWDNYLLGNSATDLSKYKSLTNIQELELQPADDPAYVNWGEEWRTPSHEQIAELVVECDWTAETIDGIKGFRVKSRKNSNSIFLPYTGKLDAGMGWTNTIEIAYYMQRTLSRSNPAQYPTLCLGIGASGEEKEAYIHQWRYEYSFVRPVSNIDKSASATALSHEAARHLLRGTWKTPSGGTLSIVDACVLGEEAKIGERNLPYPIPNIMYRPNDNQPAYNDLDYWMLRADKDGDYSAGTIYNGSTDYYAYRNLTENTVEMKLQEGGSFVTLNRFKLTEQGARAAMQGPWYILWDKDVKKRGEYWYVTGEKVDFKYFDNNKTVKYGVDCPSFKLVPLFNDGDYSNCYIVPTLGYGGGYEYALRMVSDNTENFYVYCTALSKLGQGYSRNLSNGYWLVIQRFPIIAQ